jgi:hypothetical protein
MPAVSVFMQKQIIVCCFLLVVSPLSSAQIIIIIIPRPKEIIKGVRETTKLTSISISFPSLFSLSRDVSHDFA